MYLHMTEGKNVQSNEENEEQKKFLITQEAQARTCPQNRWKLKPRISESAEETKQMIETVTINHK